MKSLKLLVRAIFAITVLATASSVNAALIQYEFNGTVRNSTFTLTGVSQGDSAVITVGLDNGGSSNINQVWTAADLQSVTFDFNNGAILTTFLSPFGGGLINSAGSFQTDAAGTLTSVMTNWSDGLIGTDWISNDPGIPSLWWLDGFNPIYQNASGQLASIVLPINIPGTPGLLDPASWTQVSAIPVPAAVWLFGTALVGLLGFGRRKKAA